MLFGHQLMTADLYNIPIGNVKKKCLTFFNKGKYVIMYIDIYMIFIYIYI